MLCDCVSTINSYDVREGCLNLYVLRCLEPRLIKAIPEDILTSSLSETSRKSFYQIMDYGLWIMEGIARVFHPRLMAIGEPSFCNYIKKTSFCN